MTSEAVQSDSWEQGVIDALGKIEVADMPALEVLVLDTVAAWMFSPENGGHSYSNHDASVLIQALFSALSNAKQFQPETSPATTEIVSRGRELFVHGAHQLAADAGGLTALITRLMPAMLGELDRHAGEPAMQAYWTYLYLLSAVMTGTARSMSEEAMESAMAIFAGWDAEFAAGYQVPWRR